MKKYLFVGGNLDGQFVVTYDDMEYHHKIYPIVYMPNEQIEVQIYKKSVVGNHQKTVVFYALDGTIFDDNLINRVFELTKNI